MSNTNVNPTLAPFRSIIESSWGYLLDAIKNGTDLDQSTIDLFKRMYLQIGEVIESDDTDPDELSDDETIALKGVVQSLYSSNNADDIISALCDQQMKNLLDTIHTVKTREKEPGFSEKEQILLEKAKSRKGPSKIGHRLSKLNIRPSMEPFVVTSNDTDEQYLVKQFLLKQPTNLHKKLQNCVLARDTYFLFLSNRKHLFSQKEAFPAEGISEEVFCAFFGHLIGNDGLSAHRRKTVMFTLRNLSRFCTICGYPSPMELHRNSAAYQSLISRSREVVSENVKQAPVMSFKEEYMLFLACDFSDMRHVRFWAMRLLSHDSGQRNSTVRHTRGKDLKFVFVRTDETVHIHMFYFLESVKTHSSGSNDSVSQADRWLPIGSSEEEWCCSGRAVLYLLCKMGWMSNDFSTILDNPPNELRVKEEFMGQYVFHKTKEELEESIKEAKSIQITAKDIENILQQTSLEPIERYKLFSEMMEVHDPNIVTLAITNSLYHQFSELIRPGKQPFSSYTDRRTVNSRAKAKSFQTGDQSKGEMSRLYLGHTRNSRIHDAYMDAAALTSTNFVSFVRSEDMGKTSVIEDPLFDTELTGIMDKFFELDFKKTPIVMKCAVEDYANLAGICKDSALHRIGLIYLGYDEYPMFSFTKQEASYFRKKLIPIFLNWTKKEYLLGDSSPYVIQDFNSDNAPTEVAYKLILREVLNEGSLNLNVEKRVPAFLLKRAIGSESNWDDMKRRLNEKHFIDVAGRCDRRIIEEYLQQNPSVVYESVQEQPTELMFPFEWFTMEDLRSHDQFETICDILCSLKCFLNYNEPTILNVIVLLIPCTNKNSDQQLRLLLDHLSDHKVIHHHEDADELVTRVLNSHFDKPLPYSSYSDLPVLIREKLFSIIVDHEEFLTFLKRIVEDNVTNPFHSRNYRAKTRINLESMKKIMNSFLNHPGRSYARLFLSVLKDLDKKERLQMFKSRLFQIDKLRKYLMERGVEFKADDSFPFNISHYKELTKDQKQKLYEAMIVDQDFLQSLLSLKGTVNMKDKLSSSHCTNVKYETLKQYVVRMTSADYMKPATQRLFYGQIIINMAKYHGWISNKTWNVEIETRSDGMLQLKGMKSIDKKQEIQHKTQDHSKTTELIEKNQQHERTTREIDTTLPKIMKKRKMTDLEDTQPNKRTRTE